MPDYKELYYSLFNDITDAIEILKKVQINSEERYIAACEKSYDNSSKHASSSDLLFTTNSKTNK